MDRAAIISGLMLKLDTFNGQHQVTECRETCMSEVRRKMNYLIRKMEKAARTEQPPTIAKDLTTLTP